MSRSKNPRPDVMTVEQVADYLQLNKLTVYKYIRDGRLPAARLGKAYRVRLADVDAFLERQIARPGRSARRPAAVSRQAVRGNPVPRTEEIAVAPQRRESVRVREHGEVSINPMEWVIRGLH